jgi:hypothetical protein
VTEHVCIKSTVLQFASQMCSACVQGAEWGSSGPACVSTQYTYLFHHSLVYHPAASGTPPAQEAGAHEHVQRPEAMNSPTDRPCHLLRLPQLLLGLLALTGCCKEAA